MLSLAATTLIRSGAYAPAESRWTAPQMDSNGNSQTAAGASQTNSSARPRAQQYGYHNTYHLHATPSTIPPHPPPTYGQPPPKRYGIARPLADVLPPYSCTVALEGQLGFKCELSSPFMAAPPQSSYWNDIYVVLNGTQLRFYRLKSSSRLSSSSKQTKAGKLFKAYSLQHAEIGLAVDIKKGEPIPKSTLGKLIPPSARQKVFETDPHLFEPVREFNIRLRVETEQILLSASTQSEMLNWTESLAAAIDIAMPLEDRTEPRYRSLPRRARRQREIEGRRSADANLSNIESQENLVRQQERLFRELYPHLAADNDQQPEPEAEAPSATEEVVNRSASQADEDGDPDADDLDRSDALVPTISASGPPTPSASETASDELQRESYFDQPTNLAASSSPSSGNTSPSPSQDPQSDAQSIDTNASSVSSTQDQDAKSLRRATPQLTPAAALRYRRRCAPVLLANSPRASDIIVSSILSTTPKSSSPDACGYAVRRVQINLRKQRLLPFEQAAPRYDAHDFASGAPSMRVNAFAPVPSLRPVLEREETAVTIMSTISTDTAATAEEESLQSQQTRLSVQSTSGDDADSETQVQHPSATESRENLTRPTSLHLGQDGSSAEEISLAPAASNMSREVSKGSLIGDKQTPATSPSAAPGIALVPAPSSTGLQQAVAPNKTRRLGLSSKFLSRKTGEQTRPERWKVAATHNKASSNGAAPGQDVAAYAALMF